MHVIAVYMAVICAVFGILALLTLLVEHVLPQTAFIRHLLEENEPLKPVEDTEIIPLDAWRPQQRRAQ